MKLRWTDAQVVEILRLYTEGAGVNEIRQAFGVSCKAIRTVLVDRNISVRTAGEQARLTTLRFSSSMKAAARKRRKIIDELGVVQGYASGRSVLWLAQNFGVQRSVISRVLREFKAQTRTASEQQRLRYTGWTTDQKCKITRAANVAARGSIIPETRLIASALARQTKGNSTAREQRWADALAEVGIHTVPQYALGRYNFDLAVPAKRVLIEVQNGWHRAKKGKHKSRDLKKRKLAQEQGWIVHWVHDRHLASRRDRWQDILIDCGFFDQRPNG